ncbi:MAG: hypothetical protein IPK67_15525 [Planctomycetes bacterium]|nr:hypothetical protein [Planctomycetota bacterium]
MLLNQRRSAKISIPSTSALGVIVWPLAAIICLASVRAPDNTGNTKFSDHGVAIMPMSATEEATERTELVEYMRDHPDVFPTALVDEIEAATDPDSGSIRIVRAWDRAPGIADSGTIGIAGGLPTWMRALILAHEYEHAERAQSSPGTGPDRKDPLTNSTPCGKCNHAVMRAGDASRSALLTCSEDYPILPEQREEICKHFKGSRAATAELLTGCYYAGCTSCCGFPYIPNCDELIPAQPCCD